MLCYCYGSVSHHFGPSAFNKFRFPFNLSGVILPQMICSSKLLFICTIIIIIIIRHAPYQCVAPHAMKLEVGQAVP